MHKCEYSLSPLILISFLSSAKLEGAHLELTFLDMINLFATALLFVCF